ncbi:biopolymer transporter Tol [Edaphobacter sp. HDX4]|uniref:biopolymer transporter Tol n=1 Tax=Edaphobacter sp. HDX4 TaxID=2794064 RepID=UPI002FE631F2
MKTLLILALATVTLHAQQTPEVPDWAQPGSPTHKQVPPPADFHRPSKIFNNRIGIFDGEADVGSALVPGSASYDPATKQYTIHSAGYNIWYSRDEFRFLWKRMSGDLSLAADVSFPNPNGYNDRKAVLIIRQNLDDDAPEAMAGQHGTGMVHLAARLTRGASLRDYEYRLSAVGLPSSSNGLTTLHPKRIGLEKRGDEIALYISVEGEPLHQFGPPIRLHFDGPFYVGIGFTSHLPATSDTAVLSNVNLVNSAGQVR